jgi:hypothetical protein
MTDRMLVRVAHHREENIGVFDEEAQRRNPCDRLEPMEEFIVVWRKGRVEFYQDLVSKSLDCADGQNVPLIERLRKQKRLCFLVPLLPNRSSLSIFNETDMTLTLATSAGRLQDDVDHMLRSNSTRSATIRDRVAQSRQAKWLRHGRRGTHIFIMKIAERSRALDWYWELWRELGGELPERIDIAVPSLSTSIRLKLPTDESMVGGKTTRRALCPSSTIKTCWEMMREAIDLDELARQRQAVAGPLDLELAWKGTDATLDWVAYVTTVQGRQRDWAVLVGLAKLQVRPRLEM